MLSLLLVLRELKLILVLTIVRLLGRGLRKIAFCLGVIVGVLIVIKTIIKICLRSLLMTWSGTNLFQIRYTTASNMVMPTSSHRDHFYSYRILPPSPFRKVRNKIERSFSPQNKLMRSDVG